MKSLIEHLERMAETLDGVTEENWLDTPQDIAQIYRSVANEIRQKMSAQNQSVTNCNQLKIRKALESALPIMRDCPFTHYNTTEVDKVVEEIESALAKPPRNCDLYKTQEEAYREWKRNRGSLSEESFYYEDWLFSEAKGEAK